MAVCRWIHSFKSLPIANLSFSTSCALSNYWRKMQGLEENPREFSPLTQLPDYSFLDGRPVPLSKGKLSKIQYQESLCKRIVELNTELDVGLELYHQKKRNEILERERIIKNKLKPKGAALLKTKKEIN